MKMLSNATSNNKSQFTEIKVLVSQLQSRFLFSLKCLARYKLADMTLYLGKAQLSSVILRGDYLMLLLTRSQAIKKQAWMATYLLSKRNLRKMNGTVGGSYFIFNRWELQIDDNMMYDQKRF